MLAGRYILNVNVLAHINVMVFFVCILCVWCNPSLYICVSCVLPTASTTGTQTNKSKHTVLLCCGFNKRMFLSLSQSRVFVNQRQLKWTVSDIVIFNEITLGTPLTIKCCMAFWVTFAILLSLMAVCQWTTTWMNEPGASFSTPSGFCPNLKEKHTITLVKRCTFCPSASMLPPLHLYPPHPTWPHALQRLLPALAALLAHGHHSAGWKRQ